MKQFSMETMKITCILDEVKSIFAIIYCFFFTCTNMLSILIEHWYVEDNVLFPTMSLEL